MIAISSARSRGGVVAAGSPYAAQAGARVLRDGGNAADAAIATALALAVADPANSSLFGRCQAIVRGSDGALQAIDGASEAPVTTPALTGSRDLREGYRAVPIPGLPRALELLHRAHGRLPLAEVVAPAAELAEGGFAPPAHLSAVWAARAAELATNPPAREAYLAQGEAVTASSAPRRMRHPRLAALIRVFGEHGADALMRGPIGRELAHAVAASGGYWTADDLAAYAAREGEVIRGKFRDCEIATVGRQAWGHTLVEMLAILDEFPAFGPSLTAIEAERLLLAFVCALSDRPQEIGSLAPKPFGLAYETLVDRAFTGRRARQIDGMLAGASAPQLAGLLAPAQLRTPVDMPAAPGRTPVADPDTTHLSVIDREGASVAMTCSIGPHFGARVADPVHGVLLAHSYRMVSDPVPGARDETEMSPVIVTRGGRLVASLGAAGSERIPGAIAQVIVNLVDRGFEIDAAIAFPRVNIKGGRMRVHADAGGAIVEALRMRGYDLAASDRGHAEHLGIVHACAVSHGGWVGAADPSWDGSAGGA